MLLPNGYRSHNDSVGGLIYQSYYGNLSGPFGFLSPYYIRALLWNDIICPRCYFTHCSSVICFLHSTIQASTFDGQLFPLGLYFICYCFPIISAAVVLKLQQILTSISSLSLSSSLCLLTGLWRSKVARM